MLVVLVLTVFVDVITAVGVGIVIASLVFVKEMADVQIQSIRTIVDDIDHDLLTADESAVFRQCNGRAAILRLSGAMSFGAANEMMRRIGALDDPRDTMRFSTRIEALETARDILATRTP